MSKETEIFLKKFPSIEKLFNFFQPRMWGYMLQHVDACVTQPCITLGKVDAIYNCDGAARQIVKAQLIGIYLTSTARDELNQHAANLAADLFVTKYGHECTLYALMLYFGNYLVEYKTSYTQFDVQDILLQFSRKFLPWWRSKIGVVTDEQETERECVVSLEQMLRIWVREGRSDEDFREGGLYRIGIVTDAMLRQARKDVEDGII